VLERANRLPADFHEFHVIKNRTTVTPASSFYRTGGPQLRIALYRAVFDLSDKGHVDVAPGRRLCLTGLIVGVFDAPPKPSVSVRGEGDLMKKALVKVPNVSVKSYNCLTIEFAKQIKASSIVRRAADGLRL